LPVRGDGRRTGEQLAAWRLSPRRRGLRSAACHALPSRQLQGTHNDEHERDDLTAMARGASGPGARAARTSAAPVGDEDVDPLRSSTSSRSCALAVVDGSGRLVDKGGVSSASRREPCGRRAAPSRPADRGRAAEAVLGAAPRGAWLKAKRPARVGVAPPAVHLLRMRTDGAPPGSRCMTASRHRGSTAIGQNAPATQGSCTREHHRHSR
jgi:hypothetical protein